MKYLVPCTMPNPYKTICVGFFFVVVANPGKNRSHGICVDLAKHFGSYKGTFLHV